MTPAMMSFCVRESVKVTCGNLAPDGLVRERSACGIRIEAADKADRSRDPCPKGPARPTSRPEGRSAARRPSRTRLVRVSASAHGRRGGSRRAVRALKGRLGLRLVLKDGVRPGVFQDAPGPSRRFSARETRRLAPRGPCPEGAARLTTRPEGRERGRLSRRAWAEPALQRTGDEEARAARSVP